MTEIVNITYTVNPKVAQGRERFKNTVTGEEWWGNDPNQLELDFTPHFAALEETFTEKAVKVVKAAVKKGRDRVKE
jgi:hypothetical protein